MLPFVRCHLDNKWLKPLYMSESFMLEDEWVPAELAHGCTLWEMASQDPTVNKMFNDAMVSGDIESLVDVGGGRGRSNGRNYCQNFPHLACSVLDLPRVVGDRPNDGIVMFVPGDMFNYIPPADAVLLKILRRCKDAIPSREAGGKVIVLEAVVGLTSQMISDESQLLFDMLMLTVTGGEERDENEWKKLFKEAGFGSYKINHTVGFMSVIEIYP
ncbi:Trans-resveratrol di-O-methyltransferase [Carex littledalei]|uniref:Trans-resveratrol di-O-methyltransferase n=1 Tax=Carex littledalei TaxID=544730 RepID=A0A833QRT3_9POAL|nr:Trans-resveratrol di-O-methyltransferase [Carex littledalei]